jgi:hypothetical protein
MASNFMPSSTLADYPPVIATFRPKNSFLGAAKSLAFTTSPPPASAAITPANGGERIAHECHRYRFEHC